MLSKLIKYDFKALSRVLLPTMAPGASLIATLSFLFTEKSYSSANNGGLATMLGGLLAVVMVLAIAARHASSCSSSSAPISTGTL